jgi:hypothetical protein
MIVSYNYREGKKVKYIISHGKIKKKIDFEIGFFSEIRS